MRQSLVRFVRGRSRGRCEYCHLPEGMVTLPFEIDHIIARQHGGVSESWNLAFACFSCNHHKGPNLSGIDPWTGRRTWLFNPRVHGWPDHHVWRGAMLIGKTPRSRATVELLKINAKHRLLQRRALMKEGVFPQP